MTVKVTLPVPPSVFRLAQQTAKVQSRPVEQVLVDVLTASSPMSDDLPAELQAEVEALAQLSDEELWNVARLTFPVADSHRYDELLERNSAGALSPTEREQLKELRLASEKLMVRKAQAYALLKWRGHVLPPLNDIPLPE